jgi:hypothetical protein
VHFKICFADIDYTFYWNNVGMLPLHIQDALGSGAALPDGTVARCPSGGAVQSTLTACIARDSV